MLKLSYSSSIRTQGALAGTRWYFQIDGQECRKPTPIDIGMWQETADNTHVPAVLTGICESIAESGAALAAGQHTVTVRIGQMLSIHVADAISGWHTASILEVQEMCPQYWFSFDSIPCWLRWMVASSFFLLKHLWCAMLFFFRGWVHFWLLIGSENLSDASFQAFLGSSQVPHSPIFVLTTFTFTILSYLFHPTIEKGNCIEEGGHCMKWQKSSSVQWFTLSLHFLLLFLRYFISLNYLYSRSYAKDITLITPGLPRA